MVMNLAAAGTDADLMVDINTTPLIDVMLVLLIMLIVTIPIQLHSVNLSMPVPVNAPPPQPPQVVRIDIAADGTLRWDGDVVPDRRALETRLREIAAQTPQAELHLRPDKQAQYRHVAAVLASAQRLGVKKLGIVGAEQFAR